MAATFPRLARAEMNAHKSATAQKVVTNFENTRSEFWTVFAVAESRGIEYDIPEELDRMTTTPRKPTSLEQINKLAEATGLSVATIQTNMEATRMKALGQAMETRSALESAVFEGEFKVDGDVEEQGIDPECAADQIDAQAEKLVLWLATWNKPDWAELVIIKNDREILHDLSQIEDREDHNHGFDGDVTSSARGATRAMEAALIKAERESQN